MKIININHSEFPAKILLGFFAGALAARNYDVTKELRTFEGALSVEDARKRALEAILSAFPDELERGLVLLEANLGSQGGDCRFDRKFFDEVRGKRPNVRFVLHYGGDPTSQFAAPASYPDGVLAIVTKTGDRAGVEWLVAQYFPQVPAPPPMPTRPGPAWPYPQGIDKSGPRL